jgi:S-adenosyl methyltransferase
MHARALLTSTPEGATAYLDADLRDPGRILGDPQLARTIDLSQPVGLMLVAILHFVRDADDPYEAVSRRLGHAVRQLPDHHLRDQRPHAARDPRGGRRRRRTDPVQFRSREEFGRFLGGLDLVPPGIVSVAEWRAETEAGPRPSAAETAVYGAVARIP